jgi:hypothetical protein
MKSLKDSKKAVAHLKRQPPTTLKTEGAHEAGAGALNEVLDRIGLPILHHDHTKKEIR